MNESQDSLGFLAIVVCFLFFIFFIMPMGSRIAELESNPSGIWECQAWELPSHEDLVGTSIEMSNGEFCQYQDDGYCYFGEGFEFRRGVDVEFFVPNKCVEEIWVKQSSLSGDSDNQ